MRPLLRIPTLVLVVCALALLGSIQSVFGDEGAPEALSPEASSSQFVVYYFHGNYRCTTCLKIESFSKETIAGSFAKDLASGELAWRVVNTDEPKNKHFVQDFELVTKSLVLVEVSEGKVKRWKNLDKVWQLVGNQDAFADYDSQETRTFIGKS
jgi:hypothetical protein